MSEPNPQSSDLPEAIVARLVHLDREGPAIFDPRADRAVLDEARRYFAGRAASAPRTARGRRRGLRWMLPLSAAAAVLVALFVARPFGERRAFDAADDVDGSGRVDILDVLALARGAEDEQRIDALAARIVSLGPSGSAR